MHLHSVLTLSIFVLTLVLMVARPRGLHEAWAAAVGAVLMLACRLVTVGQAWTTVSQGADVLAFLLALMVLSTLLESSGLFDWAAIHAARSAKGSGRVLYRNIFCLGAITTALLSLDTTAIVLTPIVIACIKRLQIPSRGFVIACAFVANTGSLLLPVSNLTNLLFQSRYHFGFGQYAERMFLPQTAALIVNYYVLTWVCRRDIPADYDTGNLPNPDAVLPDKRYFRAAAYVLVAILIGYFAASAAHVPPYAVAAVGVVMLLVAAKVRNQLDLRMVWSGISWPLFVFVIGLLSSCGAWRT